MRKFVISLDRRPDRKKHFQRVNGDYLKDWEYFTAVDGKDLLYSDLPIPIDALWRDPTLKRPVTKGEVAIAMSHMALWRKCIELDQDIMILEDDAIFDRSFFLDSEEEFIEQFMYDHLGVELLYLNHNEQAEHSPIPESLGKFDNLTIPGWPLNTTAYVITPCGARTLLYNFSQFIPVDDYMAEMVNYQRISAIAYADDIVSPSNQLGSTTYEPSPEFFTEAFNVRGVTVATDRSQAATLIESAYANGIRMTVLGDNDEWEGGDMTTMGGGHKIHYMRDYLDDLDNFEVVVFTDGYDTFYNDTVHRLLEKFFASGSNIVFAGEKTCWPDENLSSQFDQDCTYPFLNSGCYIGTVWALRTMLRKMNTPKDSDDQEAFQLRYLECKDKIGISIDTEGVIFQCTDFGADITKSAGAWKNLNTGQHFCVYHGNGGENAKLLFQKYAYNREVEHHIFIQPSISFDMPVVSFLAPTICENIINQVEAHNAWTSMVGDQFPGQEVRLSELNLLNYITELWEKKVDPVIWNMWLTHTGGIRDAFVIKYAMDSQRELKTHNDYSLVTGSVKLNDNYTGGRLYFPRQGVGNENLGVGDLLLFPGQVTHQHTSEKLTSGTKYSLTIWTRGVP